MVKALLTTDYIHANVRGILLYVGRLGVLFCLGYPLRPRHGGNKHSTRVPSDSQITTFQWPLWQI